ncbi:MAG TPA: hypothetical protein VFM37_11690 [Pseudonocardiaceae bacterium]|nr:hypothetical protein [Pseudonocardiaceae bacterium]
MPIRTNRGRAAVYRRLWAWPLRSPRHLGMAVLVVAVLATVVGIVVPDRSDPLSARRSGLPVSSHTSTTAGTEGESRASTTVPNTGTATRTTASPPVTTTPPVSAPAAPEALNVANAWARAWVNHPDGMTSEEWVAQLAPLTTEEFLPQLQTVDPANIPSTAVTGQAMPTTATARVVEADVPTDGAVLHLIVIATPAGWRVSAYDRSE